MTPKDWLHRGPATVARPTRGDLALDLIWILLILGLVLLAPWALRP